MPSYFIYRDTPMGQPADPTAALVFWPPKDSDELFDALRAKYPHFMKHSERMREAVLEFLVEEQQLTQLQTEQLPTPQTMDASPWLTSMQSMSSDTSTWSSPDMLGLATPTFGNSPQPQPHTQPLSRQPSIATAATPSSDQAPALEQMTGVFSLSDAAQPKQRIRRKMTEAEKVEYRKRRIVKACEKCAKRKRKCHHNQPEMEVVGATKTHKVAKPATTSTSKKPPAVETLPQIQEQDALIDPNLLSFSDSFDSDIQMQQFDDYSTPLQDPFPDMSLDDLLAPSVPQWPWSDTPDWTLMDSSTDGLVTQDLNQKDQFHNANEMFGRGVQHFSGNEYMSMLEDQNANRPPLLNPIVRGHGWSCEGGEGFDEMEVPQERQQPTHNAHVHDAEGLDTFLYDQSGSTIRGRGDDWNEARTYRSQESPSLAQMTLRLTGAAKAVKAFGNCLPPSSSRRSRLSTISLRKVALVALGGLCIAQQQHAPLAINSRLLGGPEPRDPGHAFGTRDLTNPSHMRKHLRHQLSSTDEKAYCHQCQQCPRSFLCVSDLKHHMRVREVEPQTLLKGVFNKQCTANDPLEGMSIDDYLRMRTNVSPVQEDGRAAVSITPHTPNSQRETGTPDLHANQQAMVERGALSKGLGMNPAPGSNGRMLQHSHTAAQEGRHIPSLGEGIESSKSPSTELFMLKRRIPKALHSIVDRNSPSASLGPLLTTISENVDTETRRDRTETQRDQGQTTRDQEREMVISRNTECTEGNAVLRNYGNLGVLANAEQPVHTIAGMARYTTLQDAIAAGFSGEASRYYVSHSDAANSNVPNQAQNARIAAPTNVHSTTVDVTTKGALATQCEVYEGRLSDHMRRRDHFGRQHLSIQAMETFVSIACLGLLYLLPTNTTNLSLLLLALASPVPGAKGTHHARSTQFASQVWGTMLQCTIKNSSWLGEIQTEHVQNHQPARTFVQRLMYRGCRQNTSINGTLWRKGAGKKDGPCV